MTWHGGHAIFWSIDGGTIEAEVRCTGEPGAWCRLVCEGARTSGCEGWNFDEGKPCGCPKIDGGDCWVAPYFDDKYEIPEDYDGPPSGLFSGPIEVRWDSMDEHYGWRYPDAA